MYWVFAIISALICFGLGFGASRWIASRQRSTSSENSFVDSILDTVTDAIIVTDTEGNLVRFNHSTSVIIGIPEDDLARMHISDLVSHPKLLMGAFLSKMREGEFPKNVEFNFETQNRGLVPALLSAGGLKDHESEDRFVFLIKDIADMKRAHEELEEQRAVAIHSSKLATLGEMAGGIAHEINNPLSVIVGFAGKLQRLSKRGALSEDELMKISESIKQTAIRISKIIKSMRMLSRDGTDDPLEPYSIQALIEDTLALCQEKMISRGVELHIDVPEEICEIDCRPVQLGQVFLNLFLNASDAIKEFEERWLKVELHNLPESENVEIWVTDSGLGIPEGLRDKILQPFFTTKEVGQGTGLGLSISKRIIENHGGKLVIDNQCQNTRFKVILPRTDPNDLRKLAFSASA